MKSLREFESRDVNGYAGVIAKVVEGIRSPRKAAERKNSIGNF